MSTLDRLPDWKLFERLAADLLAVEGFILDAEPSVDRMGADFVALEEYRSHDPGRTIRIRWRVQCKHYAGSGKNLGRKEVEEALYSYEAARGADEGLFLMVSSDYTEAAKEVIDRYHLTRPDARVTIWNKRQIEAKLDRHPEVLKRYGLLHPEHAYVPTLSGLARYAPLTVLFISDQSTLAHNLARAFRQVGFEVFFLPFLNYHDPVRLELFISSFAEIKFGLSVCFLGDSFGLPMPRRLTGLLRTMHHSGTPTLLFPFVAWSMSKGIYKELEGICPVELLDPTAHAETTSGEQIIGDYRRGDFRWLLSFDSFAEDRYVEFDPGDAHAAFRDGVEARFGLSHSFEFLRPAKNATVAWKDTVGNPFLVVSDTKAAKTAYLNTCCHGCMAPVAITSPLEASPEFSVVLRNCLEWMLM